MNALALCSIDGCESTVKARGWCRAHYLRWHRSGTPEGVRPFNLGRPCSVAECDRPSKSRGWCQTHYTRWWTNGDVVRIRNRDRVCSVARCDRPVRVREWCNRHYQQWRTHGAAGRDTHAPPLERFMRMVDFTVPWRCWFWLGPTSPTGYGQFWNGQRTVAAHRWSYEHFRAPIPEGLLIMHSCDTPLCVNPLHLNTGTHLDNARDCSAKGRRRNGYSR